MEVTEIVKGVITKAITFYAEKAAIDRRKVQLSLFVDANNNNNAGSKILVNYQFADDLKIKSMLGFYSLMYGVVNSTICKSIERYAVEFSVTPYNILAMFWLNNGALDGWIYVNGEAKKKINIEDIIT